MIRYFLANIFKTTEAAFTAVIIIAFFSFNLEGATVTDSSITDAVEDELSGDPAVISDLIDVNIRGGIVTLTGTESNILAKERAANLAMEVKGVRSVVNRIKVDPPVPVTDEQLKADVKKILLLDPATEAYKVDVKADSGVVTLSGNVETWREKRLLGRVAKGVYGVKDLKNGIEVKYPRDRSDNDIRLEIERELAWDAYVDDGLINVNVKNGRVVLSGTVGSAAEKIRAETDAMVEGAKDFDFSKLKVEEWARDEKFRNLKIKNRSKTEIENALEEAFRQDPRIRHLDIRPEVMNDKVTVILRGTVDNLKAKRAAVQDARNTSGIEDVINRIKVRVRTSALPNDNDLKSRIYDALESDPYIRAYDILIGTLKGVVTLRGTVDTYFEKVRLDDVVSKVKGVVMVKNKVDVLNSEYPYVYNPYLEEPYIGSTVVGSYSNKNAAGDRKIKKAIEKKLWWSPFVDSDDIDVTVDDGEATLTGKVDSFTQYSIAASKAYEGGAFYVDNELTVAE